MSFAKSILTTFGIFLLVWGMVLVNTNKYQNVHNADAVSALGTSRSNVITLIGVRQEITLGGNGSESSALWEKFYGASDLHLSVDQEVSKRVFAYYEFKNPDLSMADLVIGYAAAAKEFDGYSISPSISTSGYEQIFESDESWDTTPGWNAIKEDREVHSVLEEYVMGVGRDVASTKAYVRYK